MSFGYVFLAKCAVTIFNSKNSKDFFTYEATHHVAEAHKALLGSGEVYHARTTHSEEYVILAIHMKSPHNVVPKVHHVQFSVKNVESVDYIFARDDKEVHTQVGHKVDGDGHVVISDSYTAGVYIDTLFIKVKPIPGHAVNLFNLELEACMEPC